MATRGGGGDTRGQHNIHQMINRAITKANGQAIMINYKILILDLLFIIVPQLTTLHQPFVQFILVEDIMKGGYVWTICALYFIATYVQGSENDLSVMKFRRIKATNGEIQKKGGNPYYSLDGEMTHF